MSTIVFPGETVNVESGADKVIRLGAGLLKEEVNKIHMHCIGYLMLPTACARNAGRIRGDQGRESAMRARAAQVQRRWVTETGEAEFPTALCGTSSFTVRVFAQYIPLVEDFVLGVITEMASEYYKVHLMLSGSSSNFE